MAAFLSAWKAHRLLVLRSPVRWHLGVAFPDQPSKELTHWDAWVAQLVKHLPVDLSSGLDLRVLSSTSVLGMEPT